MTTNPIPQSGSANPRAFAAFLLCAVSGLLTMLSFASTPTTGTITPDNPKLTYTAGPFFVINPAPVPEVDNGPRCNNPAQPCDQFALTVNLPANYIENNPGAALKVTAGWHDTGTSNSDYDLYVFKNPRNDCSPNDCTVTNGSQKADTQSASSSNPEVATIPLVDGISKYTVVVVPYTPTGESVNVVVELLQSAAPGSPTFGMADPTVPGNPRFQNFYAPPGSAKSRSGEFNIGFNPKTGRIMTMNDGPIWRLTPPELLTPKQPECCEALWEDKSNDTLAFGLDPILWTDQKTGRTFASNSTVGANAVYGYSDNDGDSWIPFGIAAPNGGADHETIGSGPYPAVLSALATPVNQGEAVYYCSQDIVGPATCYRSDDLGVSYGPSVLAYTGKGASAPNGTCGGLHGHLHVAPDGAVWLPVPQCSGSPGGVFSTDAGTTWHTFQVPNAKSQIQGADPSIAIDADSTIYFAYINNEPVPAGHQPEGHARVQAGQLDAVSNTIRWSNNFDLGATHGILNAVEIEAVGGSSGRAAVGFIGTNISGDYQAQNFPGKWYAFIATTYDGGKNWVTVNATPNDPVQSETGVWQQGGSALDRNLLDFNEITIDDKGRVLYGYSDGCVSTGCIGGTGPNDFVAYMRVARQIGGKSLFESYDANTDTTTAALPKKACLSGKRDNTAVHLTWKTPDNGGADITGYNIFRGTTSGGENATPIGHTTTKNTFIDTTANPAVSDYYYVVQAVNSVGAGAFSNEVDLQPAMIPPDVPATSCSGANVVTDNVGDAINPAPASQQPTDQSDITAISFSADNSGSTITAKMTIANLSSTPSVGNTVMLYRIVWTAPNGKTYAAEAQVSAGDQVVYGWAEYDGPSDGFVDGSLTAANSTTGTFTPGVNGTITIDVPAASVGQPTIPVYDDSGAIPAVRNPYGIVFGGEGTAGFVVTYWLRPADRAPDFDQGVDGSGFGQSWAVCTRPNNPPVAALSANPTSGTDPLSVNLDGSGSFDPDTAPPPDTIASYTFSFGDGSQSVTQASPTLTHTYYYNQACGSGPCTYVTSLTVTDSRGMQSQNSAQVVITVSGGRAGSPSPTPSSSPTPSPTPTPTATPTPPPPPQGGLNAPLMTISASPSVIQRGQSATYTITASKAAAQNLVVSYAMAGTALPGVDYNLSTNAGQLVIPAGQKTATVTLTSLKNLTGKSGATATMTLKSGTGYINGASPSTTVTIN